MAADDYQADTDEQTTIARSFYDRDYTRTWPGLTLKRAKEIGDEIGVDWDLVDLGSSSKALKKKWSTARSTAPKPRFTMTIT